MVFCYSNLSGLRHSSGVVAPHPALNTSYAYDSLTKNRVWKEKNQKLIVEKAGKRWFKQMIEVNVLSDRSRWYHVLSHGMPGEGYITSVLLVPKTHNPNLDMRRISDKPKRRNLL